MKKLIATTLALAAVFSMTACGNKTENPGETQVQDATGGAGMMVIPEEETKPLTPPTEEEVAALQEYANVLAALKKYEETGILTYTNAEGKKLTKENAASSGAGNDAVKACYDVINNAVVVDKYANTQYAADYDIEWDRQSVLNKFACVENVWWGMTRRNFEKGEAIEIEPTTLWLVMGFDYNANGQLLSIPISRYTGDEAEELPYLYPEHVDPTMSKKRWCHYDETGKLVKVEYDSSVGTPEYDEKGKMIAIHMVTEEGKKYDITYAYNDRDQITEVKSFRASTVKINDVDKVPCYHVYTFDYDDQGRLIRAEEKHVDIGGCYEGNWNYVREYSYDPSGKKITAVDTVTKSFKSPRVCVDKLTYELDDDGHVVMLTVERGDWIGIDGDEAGVVLEEAKYGTAVYWYEYSDVWVYEPAQYTNRGYAAWKEYQEDKLCKR